MINFNNDVDFSHAHFHGIQTSITHVQFNGTKTNFSHAKFDTESVSFLMTHFNGTNVDFSYTKFHGSEASFNSTKFHAQKINFAHSVFLSDKILFYEASFMGEINFGHVQFNNFTSFGDAIIDKNAEIEFNSDLSKVSFYNVKIGTNMKFGLYTKWNKQNKIYDEIRLEENDSNGLRLIAGIISQYQGLRDNYEYNFNYEDAGKFFIRESEVLRNYEDPNPFENKTTFSNKLKSAFSKSKKIEEKKSEEEILKIKKKSRFHRYVSIPFVYKHIADYGESYKKPLGILIIIFTYTMLSSAVLQHVENNLDILDAFAYGTSRALGAFVPYLDVADTTDKPWDYAVKAIALPLTGLSFIALKRRFERKYRNTVLGN
ncbi:hypothetical protein NZNM25_00870 [Nitrosopumilus zosterae]|uniref:Pentapeptide repeat-containing protein n=1 Tax=Nitrosopumilus zosterae TaxID=718286 RepID=A0A2S2KNT4_9ARCH|nr:hypothetical protein [Nitrosopumilus zosterae]BDQ31082.1 hypothetical protein NZOSNM25_001192 [Nitrosopumilus zosterae]GBH33296.1 hypothetical protein NZNM25_00870 [Nitrosopumilus zosterae]